MHDLHCSFAPGLVEADEESTGCQVTLLSPYSSIMRTSLWGGIPISLPAMAVFAFLLFRAIEILVVPAAQRRTAAAIALATSPIPVLASAVMGYIAFTELHAACKLCIGTYIASGTSLLMAGLAWLMARGEASLLAEADPTGAETGAESFAAQAQPVRAATAWLSAAGQAFGFVTVPVVAYALLVPDYSRYIGTCGALIEPDDPYGVMVELGPQGRGAPTIEVFDPLCPACRGFEERLQASGLDARLQRRAVMFPLDSECNWMVTRSLHPGACRVSEAVLCAADDPQTNVDAVVQWAFEHQEELMETGKGSLEAVTKKIAGQFPALSKCLGSAEVKSRINKSLRWTVKNELPVMTPQLYVAGTKLCDEDSDLGLDFTLDRMLQRHASGQLAADAPASTAEPGLVPGSEAASSPKSEPRKGERGRDARSRPIAKTPKATEPKAPAGPEAKEPAEPEAKAPAEPEPEAKTPAEPEPEAKTPAEAPDAKLPSVQELPPPAEDEPTPEDGAP